MDFVSEASTFRFVLTLSVFFYKVSLWVCPEHLLDLKANHLAPGALMGVSPVTAYIER
jgi:hypothetical protein